MQMWKKICRKSETSLAFSYENIVTAGTNLRPVKAMRPDEGFVSLAQIDYACLSCFLLAEIRIHKPFWCLDLLISWCMAHVYINNILCLK